MIRVQKIAHASYSTTDLDVMTEYYTGILGLSIAAREKDAVFFGSTVDHHSVVLRKGDDARCTRIGFQISPDDDLAAFAKQVESQGIGTSLKKDPEPAISEMVTFADPKGTIMEVFKPASFSRQQFQNSGIVPLKLGHVAFHVTDVKLTTKFYCDVLGFRELDWMADVFSFLRCGPDHHAINLVQTGLSRHHHTAFELRDWAHIQSACDYLSRNGFKLLWGPGRHGIGHNLFTYHRAPNGLVTELFAELDRMDENLGYFEPRPWHRDSPQTPKVWPLDPMTANQWGVVPDELGTAF